MSAKWPRAVGVAKGGWGWGGDGALHSSFLNSKIMVLKLLVTIGESTFPLR